MLTSLKTMSAVIIILGIINAIAAILVLMMLAPYISPTAGIALGAFMGSTSIVLLITGTTLWNLHSDIDTNIASLNSYTAALKKRIEALEKKF